MLEERPSFHGVCGVQELFFRLSSLFIISLTTGVSTTPEPLHPGPPQSLYSPPPLIPSCLGRTWLLPMLLVFLSSSSSVLLEQQGKKSRFRADPFHFNNLHLPRNPLRGAEFRIHDWRWGFVCRAMTAGSNHRERCKPADQINVSPFLQVTASTAHRAECIGMYRDVFLEGLPQMCMAHLVTALLSWNFDWYL